MHQLTTTTFFITKEDDMNHMNSRITIIAVLAGVFLSSCGLKFRDTNVNLGLPDDWKYRTPVKNTADLRFHMAENVGLLLTPGSVPGTYDVLSQPILPDNFSVREETIKDGAVYSSKITQGASMEGGYLTFAGSLSAEESVDFRIIDLSRADVPWNSFPDAQIRAAAAISNPQNIKRLWVQSFILSRILSQNYTEIKCDASGAGPAFQAGGKCFNQTGTESHDYAIAVVFVDIDKYVESNPGNAATPDTERIFNNLHTMTMVKAGWPKNENQMPAIPSFISIQPPYGELKGILKK
jgi:hypothetical protein